MICKYQELTRLEMEQVDRENTIVLIPLGALEQHGNQAPLGTDTLIATAMCDYIEKELTDEDINLLLFAGEMMGRKSNRSPDRATLIAQITSSHVLFGR